MDEKEYENALAHFGKIGMKWGVRVGRKTGPNSASKKNAEAFEKAKEKVAAEPIRVEVRRGKLAKASGGKYAMPSEEAIRAAALRQKVKESTTDSLSNKDLQELISRMNLEQQYAKVVTKPRSNSAAAKFAQEVVVGTLQSTIKTSIGDVAKSQTKKALTDAGWIIADQSGNAAKKAAKKAAKAAASS